MLVFYKPPHTHHLWLPWKYFWICLDNLFTNTMVSSYFLRNVPISKYLQLCTNTYQIAFIYSIDRLKALYVDRVFRFIYFSCVFLNARSKPNSLAGHACSLTCSSLVEPPWQCTYTSLSTVLLTLNAWENTLRHDCRIHITHVHKNPCGSRDFPNQALLFLNCMPILSLLPSIMVF